MSLEDDIAQSLSEEIAKKIDKDLLDDLITDVLVNDGWIATKINPAFGDSILPNFDWYAETAEWVHINARGDYKLLKGQWLFENPEDAVLFTLRWS